MKKIAEMSWEELQPILKDAGANDDTFNQAWDRQTVLEIKVLRDLCEKLPEGSFLYELFNNSAYRAERSLEEHRFDIELLRKREIVHPDPKKFGLNYLPPAGGA